MEMKDVYIDNLIKEIVFYIENFSNKSDIISVILTGSLGRDEGTFHFDTNMNKLVLDSDVELALVYKSGCKKSAEDLKNELINHFSEEMNPMTISFSRVKNMYNFNYSFVTPKYSSIFMYDLYNGSKTIWGEDLINKKIFKYDKYEAKRIIANRIGELTYISNFNESNFRQINQWEAKLILAIGTAYCILKDSYMSSYYSQYEFICNEQDNINNFLGENFVDDYTKAFYFLRRGADNYDVPSERLNKYVEKMNSLLNTKEFSKPKINSISRKIKYMISCKRANVPLNPINCETIIIEGLIKYFSEKDVNLILFSNYWKMILY